MLSAWSKPTNITDSYPAYWSDIVVDDNDVVHIVYSDDAPDEARVISGEDCIPGSCSWVFYVRSSDGGDTWTKPMKISPPLASGGRVMLARGPQDDLYVVWSTERYEMRGVFVTSRNGFAYSEDGGHSWSAPETQIVATGTPNEPEDYWLSIAVDSQQTIHVFGQGSGFVHLRRDGPSGAWRQEPTPTWDVHGLGGGYGFRNIIVDGNDDLHIVMPTVQLPGSTVRPGLFHNVWRRDRGWTNWRRATTNMRGIGQGLGNLVLRNGNEIGVVWQEHLETSVGHLFRRPYGTIEIYYASFKTDAPAAPTVALLAQPTSLMPSGTGESRTSTPVPTTPAPTPPTWSGNRQPPRPIPAGAGVAGGIGVGALALIGGAAVSVQRRRR